MKPVVFRRLHRGCRRIKVSASTYYRETLICTEFESGQIGVQMQTVLPPARRFAAGLMLLSGVTHIAQLAVYKGHADVIGAAMFGVLYLLLGAYLLTPKRAALWLASIFPLIGGSLGILRFLTVRPNPFSVLHVVIDVAVISTCVWLLTRREAAPMPA